MKFLRSLLFNIFFILWAFFSSLLFAPLFVISKNASIKSGRPWAKGSLWLLKFFCNITYEVRGREHITQTPVIYACKHQSAWDTIMLLVLLDRPAYVLKKSLLMLPFWGWYLWRMGMIAIDRTAGASAIKKMIRDAQGEISSNRPIVIYPEGTRKKPGDAPGYLPGIVALYNQLDLPVVPVALNSGMFWGRDAFIKKPGKVIIQFLPPIAPGQPKATFKRELEDAIENASNQLIKEFL